MNYKESIHAVAQLLREAEATRRTLDESELERSNFPGYPLLRAHEMADYLRRMKDWMERVRGEWKTPAR